MSRPEYRSWSGKHGTYRMSYFYPNRMSFVQELETHGPQTKELQAAIKNLKFGWGEKLPAKFQELFKGFRFKISSRIPKTTWKEDVVGSRPNIGAIVSGMPNMMYRRIKSASERKGRSKYVYILANVDGYAGMWGDMYYLRGAATLALVYCLEAAGYKVRVGIGIASRPLSSASPKAQDRGQYHQQYVTIVKDYETPTNPAVLGYLLGSRDVLWTLWVHYWWHVLPEHEKKEFYPGYYGGGWGYGAIGDIYKHGADIYFPPPTHPDYKNMSFTDEKAAMKWIEAQLKKFGVVLE